MRAANFAVKFPAGLAVLAMCTLLCQPAMAKEPRLAVVPAPDRLHPIVGVAVQNFIDKPLAQQLSVVPPAVVKKALRRGHLAGAGLRNPRRLVALGHAVGATHVAVIDVAGRGKATVSHVHVIDVATGATVMRERFALPKAVLNAAAAKQIVAAIVEKIAAPEPAAAGEAGAEATAQTKPGAGFAFPGGGDTKPGETKAEPEGHAAAEAADDKEAKDGVKTAEAPPGEKADRALRRASRLAVGLALLQRTGHLNADPNEGFKTPCYCGTNNNANPLFPAFRLEGELFPGGLASDSNSWYTNIGVTLAFDVAPVKSYTSSNANTNVADANSAISSTVTDLRAGLAYRLKWWGADLAPDNFIQVGVNYFSFPLAKTAFPGVAYTSPYVGLDFHIPVVENFMLQVDAAYMFALKAGNDAGKLLGTQHGGQAFTVGGGVITGLNRFQVGLTAHYERYMLKYTGSTSLNATPVPNNGTSPVQWGDVKLVDALIRLQLVAGVLF